MPAPRSQPWFIVGLLGLGFTIAYIDRTNLSIALASADFRSAFGLTDSQRGLLNSAFFWSYALLQIPAGFLTDRYGVRIPYAVSFALWSVVSALTALAGSLWQLIALRILLGIGEAIVTPASMRWITTHVGEKQRGLAVGILLSGAKFGPALGAWLSVLLIQDYGWRWMFVILGLSSLLFLIPWFAMVKEDSTAPVPEDLKVAPASADFGAIWRTPAIYGILVGTIAYNYFNYFNLTWLPAYFVDRWGLKLNQMGFYTTFAFLGMAVTSIGAGAVADLLIRRGWSAVRVRKGFTIAGLAIASTEVLGAFTSSRDLALTFAIISMAGLGLTTANYWALTQTLMPRGASGRISGVQNFASNIAGIASPIVTGWLVQKTGSYAAPQYAILGVLIAGILAYVLLVREEYAPVQQ